MGCPSNRCSSPPYTPASESASLRRQIDRAPSTVSTAPVLIIRPFHSTFGPPVDILLHDSRQAAGREERSRAQPTRPSPKPNTQGEHADPTERRSTEFHGGDH